MEGYTRKVYYYETDKMAIVHNANYLRIYEEARLDHMNKLGIPYTLIEDNNILIPVVDAYVRYHNTLRYGDEFCADVKLISFNGIRMEFSYEIKRTCDGVLISDGHTSHCFIDEETRIPLNIKKRLPDAFQKMAEGVAR